MKNQPVFRGAATAIVTPMNEKGVDYEAFERLPLVPMEKDHEEVLLQCMRNVGINV